MRLIAAIVAAFLLLFLVWFFGFEADAHWKYEMACCNTQDCMPVEDKIVTETSAGFTLNDTGEFVERTSHKIRKPINEEYHVCRNPAGALLCIYPKLQGM